MIVIGKEVVEWVAKKTNEFGSFGTDVGIGWSKNGELVAGVAYAEWNGVNVVCHIASDGSKRWLTRQYLWTIFDYAFVQAGVKRITVAIGEGNEDSQIFVEHLGFALEATLEAAHPTGDLLIYRMWKKDCQWLALDLKKPYAMAA